MILYHRTPHAESIISEGFRDAEGQYLADEVHRGVWLSDRPLDCNEGAKREGLLVLEMPEEKIAEYEWVEEGKPYREFLIPAILVNSFGPPAICDEDEFHQ